MPYTLSLTQEDLRVLAAALQELPYKLAAPLLSKLQEQVSKQDEAAAKDKAMSEVQQKLAESQAQVSKKSRQN